jgi:hypothetical protein
MVVLSVFVAACEKEITIDLPDAVSKIVVQGSIEQGQPPFVLLSESQGYFEPTDIGSLESLYLSGAEVSITRNGETVQLQEICSSDIPEELLPLVTELTGFSAELLSAINICAYTTFDESFYGEEGGVYDLHVSHNAREVHASTKINTIVDLDSAWFEVTGNADTLGFLYAALTDPDTLGNAYRWFAKRINKYPHWSELAGEQKDKSFIAPLGSAYDDEFFNGLSFDFAYYRGSLPNSQKPDDSNDERGYYKVGDTVAVKGCVIDRGAFVFITSFENQISNQGTPFATPANVKTNVDGGLGAWIGYGAIYDTIICVP